MEYWLARAYLGTSPKVSVSLAEANLIDASVRCLNTLIDIEEHFYILLENFIEFEACLLKQALTFELRPIYPHNVFFDQSIEVNRLAINLLAAFVFYEDSLRANLARLKSQSLSAIRPRTYKYPAGSEHRFVRALRNHACHFGMPVSSRSISSAWVGDEPSRRRVGGKLSVLRRALERDPDFKLDLLDQLDEPIELKRIFRSHLDRLSALHKSMREHLADYANEWVAEIGRRIKSVVHLDTEDSFGAVSLFSQSDQKAPEPVCVLLEEQIDRLSHLRDKNWTTVNLSRAYVTSEDIS